MDFLLAYYAEKFEKTTGNVYDEFTNFYTSDLSPVEAWLEARFQKRVQKDNESSYRFRQEGNKHFAGKELLKSLEFYTKSLCFAMPNSQEYGLALANRSAVSFELKLFEDCLNDIQMCFRSNYPNELKPKVYLRKAECYYQMARVQDLSKTLYELADFAATDDYNLKDQKKVSDRMKYLVTKLKENENSNLKSDLPIDTIELYDGENEQFAYASNKIKLSYDKTKGRHVVAKQNIRQGDILFIEKAFLFAPVFKENKEFCTLKCYDCLKDVVSSIPCRTCTLCVYCDENCQKSSWQSCHQWECEGMQANIWYDFGIAFPALKAMLKGVKSRFNQLKGSFKNDTDHFGDKSDNYPYFNRLLSNIYKTKNAAQYIIPAAVVVTYLKKYTNFFPWFLEKKNCPKNDLSSLETFIGGLLTKHIAQLLCNSSIIVHWTYSSNDLLFPDILTSIACGMFPSVSMMNHSCRPNITNYFIGDTIVVKALDDIPKDEEVFNCYGIDFRNMNKEQRQIACRSLYHFECTCIICSDPLKEIEMLDSYLCLKCRGLVPELQNTAISLCLNCGEKYSLKPFRKINTEAQKYLENEEVNQLESLLRSLQIREKILYKHHIDFEEIYYRLYRYYVEIGDAENMFKYFHLWLENEKARRGANSRGAGTKLYEAALAILHCLQNGQPKNCINLKAFLQNVECMIKEAKLILNLYYPPSITNRLSRKIQFISNK